MKVTNIGTSQVIRDFVTDHYPSNALDLTALMLSACADTIDRLTRERDLALAMVRSLKESSHDCKQG